MGIQDTQAHHITISLWMEPRVLGGLRLCVTMHLASGLGWHFPSLIQNMYPNHSLQDIFRSYQRTLKASFNHNWNLLPL